MSSHTDQLRMAAALAHSAPDADVVLTGPARRWLVSYRRSDATVDPCAFRQLVLAAWRGCRVGLLPVERVAFVGALRDIGGGVFERHGPRGPERRVATFLCPARVDALLAELPDVGDALTAHVRGDDELGVTVVTLGWALGGRSHGLDVAAHRLTTACLVAELTDASVPGDSPR